MKVITFSLTAFSLIAICCLSMLASDATTTIGEEISVTDMAEIDGGNDGDSCIPDGSIPVDFCCTHTHNLDIGCGETAGDCEDDEC